MTATDAFGPWNPGLSSSIPGHLLSRVTLFAPGNSSVDYAQAKELADFTGLAAEELMVFTAWRLAMHETLVQVTADLHVPDGPDYADLGINLRSMAATILAEYLEAERTQLETLYEETRAEVEGLVRAELEARIFSAQPRSAGGKPTFWQRLFGGNEQPKAKPVSREERTQAALGHWREALEGSPDPLRLWALRALVKTVKAITAHRGTLIADVDLLTRITTGLAVNDLASERIGTFIRPFVSQAAEAHSYAVLPPQADPFVMNVKGASASGKSTIRAKQRQLAEKLDVPWEDFAVISPDYWRKLLIDYDGMGDDFKYAAMLSGKELEIIDRKLDRHMAQKAAGGVMSHLLIDRFRFDSFHPLSERPADSRLLTRFGETIFLFFMITPPAETVVRAWGRGLETGRYKAVDDLLYHNVEAYSGMAGLFFSWATTEEKNVHYEFLDNGVPKGATPRSVAFGWNGELTIVDVELITMIDHYRHVSVDAQSPEEVFAKVDASAEDVLGFLKQCVKAMKAVNFASPGDRQVYGRIENGEWAWRAEDTELKTSTLKLLRAIGWDDAPTVSPGEDRNSTLEGEEAYTLGAW